MKNKLLNIPKLLLLLLLLTGSGGAWAQTDLFFSEYIEGSSNNKALEIYNGTGAAIDLAANGYVIQMYFNGNTTAGTTINLTGTVASNDVFIFASSSASTTILDQADQTSGASLFNGDDAIVLRKGGATGTIIDVIGQIGTDPGTEWGTGLTSTADNTLRRKASITSGDPNGSDAFDPAEQFNGFATDTFSGLGTHEVDNNQNPTLSIADATVNEGNSGTTSAAFTVTLSAPVTGPVTFDIATADGSAMAGNDYTTVALTNQTIPAGSTTYTFNVPVIGDTQPEQNETFTVNLANISGASPGDVSATGTITNDDGVLVTPIYTIQGSGSTSPLAGDEITTTGVVVGDYQNSTQLNGFFIQDATGDNNAATSDGIFVYAPNSIDVTVGQVVRVTGKIEEAFGQTQISAITNITLQGNGAVTPTAVNLPVNSTNMLEQYEGMLVTFPEKLTVTENFGLARYGEVLLSADLDYPFDEGDGRLFNPTNFIDPTDTPASGAENDEDNKAAVTTQQNLHNRSAIILDDASSAQNPATIPYLGPDNTLRTGSTVNDLTGILSFGFSAYRLQPTQAPNFAYAPRPLTPPSVNAASGKAANVKIASFNVLNYFNGDGNGGGFPTSRGADNQTEFNRQRAKIISAITGLNADVIGLLEIENDGDGVNSAIADLVNGLNETTSPGTYDYIRDPGNGGTGTDAIKVAFIYQPGVVTPVGAAIADLNPVHNRPPLAQTFRLNANGEIVTAVINHFKSKGGSGTGANADQGDGQGAFNADRVEQAGALVSFINATVIPAAGDKDVILLGDFNAYNEEDPIDVLRAAGFINLFGPESYSYVFDGQSGSLDHALVSTSLQQQFTAGGKWHINADEPLFLDYNTEFKTAAQINEFYAPTPFRSSDHDPVLAGFNLSTPSISFAHATATINEGAGTYTVNLALSETVREDATINLSITNGTGVVYGTDYTTTPDGSANSFTVTIPAGSSAASFTVNVIDDQLDEYDETVNFAITQVNGGLIAGNQTTSSLTIEDNDVPVISFSTSSATINSGSDTYTVTLTASIAPVSNQTVTISINDYDLEYGSEKGYETNPAGATGSITLTIPAGQTTASFTITTDKNMVKKQDSPQQLDFTISQVSDGATIGTPQTFVLNITDKKKNTPKLISIFPNPATTNANIKVENAGTGEVIITLISQTGKVVLCKKVRNTTDNLDTFIEVGEFRRGNYVLLICMPQGILINHLLLK